MRLFGWWRRDEEKSPSGLRGINIVNTEPVGGVPNPGGLPAADSPFTTPPLEEIGKPE